MVTRQNSRKAERGQVLILFSFFLVALLLFAGMAIDFGMAYVTSAQIGKAADSAALTAARYSALGTAGATALATSAYNMNYNATSLDYGEPKGAPGVVVSPPVVRDPLAPRQVKLRWHALDCQCHRNQSDVFDRTIARV